MRIRRIDPEDSQVRYSDPRYRFEARLGGGTQGEVWRALDQLDRETAVAIKVIHSVSDPADIKFLLKSLEHEAKLMAQIRSEYVVAIKDVREIGGRVAIVMELLDTTLYDWSRRRGSGQSYALPPGEVALVGSCILRGLAEAHAERIVHRDVKPTNIFLRLSEDKRRVDAAKVGDFGVGKCLGAMSYAHTFCGTPLYMAPECLSRGGVDARADVYSAGATLYEMATGRRAFDCAHPDELADAICTGRCEAAHEVEPGVPKALSEIIARCMHVNPNRRYQSAREAGEAMEHWIETGLPENRLARAAKAGAAEAETIYRQLVQESPELLEPYLRLGALLQRQFRYVEAEALWRQAMGRHRDSGRLQASLARNLQIQRKENEARAHYTKALQMGDLGEKLTRECRKQLAKLSPKESSR